MVAFRETREQSHLTGGHDPGGAGSRQSPLSWSGISILFGLFVLLCKIQTLGIGCPFGMCSCLMGSACFYPVAEKSYGICNYFLRVCFNKYNHGIKRIAL